MSLVSRAISDQTEPVQELRVACLFVMYSQTAIIEKPARLTNSRLWRHQATALSWANGPLANRCKQQPSHTAQLSKSRAQRSICRPVTLAGSSTKKATTRASYTPDLQSSWGKPVIPAHLPCQLLQLWKRNSINLPGLNSETSHASNVIWIRKRLKIPQDLGCSHVFKHRRQDLLTPGSAGETPALPAARFP